MLYLLFTVIELLSSLHLSDFPSGSAITLHKDRIYVVGDDANSILVVDKHYTRLDTIPLFSFPDKRISKVDKPDFETSAVIQINGIDHLLVLGSASRPNREKALLLSLDDYKIQNIDLSAFIARLKTTLIGELNIEGSAAMNDLFMISNRANLSNPQNSLIITTPDFWKAQQSCKIKTIKLQLPDSVKTLGVSEITYVESRDLLLFTLTRELTTNAYDDGAIGDSYIGWIDQVSKKLNEPSVSLNGLINLSDSNKEFIQEKIEGLLVEDLIQDALILHLVSDNDAGESRLFKIKFSKK